MIDRAQSRPPQLMGEGISPSWFPGSNRLAFVTRSRGGDKWNSFSVSTDAPNATKRLEQTQLTEDPLEEIDRLAISPDGKWLAFSVFKQYVSGRIDESYIYLRSLEQKVKPKKLSQSYYPVWSPDSSKLAFYDSTQDKVTVLGISDSRELASFSLPDISFSSLQVVWSPDRNQNLLLISYALCEGSKGDCTTKNYVANLQNASSLTALPDARGSTWSPNGKEIVIEQEGKLFKMNSDGSNLLKLLP